MYCPFCGKETVEGAAFCVHCGKPVAPVAPAAETVQAAPAAQDTKDQQDDRPLQYTVTFIRHDVEGPDLTITMSNGENASLINKDSCSFSLPSGTYKFTLDAGSQHEEREISLNGDTTVNLFWLGIQHRFHIVFGEPLNQKTESASGSNDPQEPKPKKHGVFFWLVQIVCGGILLFGFILWLTTPREIISFWKHGLSDQVYESVDEYLSDFNGFSGFRKPDSFGKENVVSSEKIKLTEVQKNLLEWGSDDSLKDTMTEYVIETAWYVFDDTWEGAGTLTVQNTVWVQGDYYWVWDTSFSPDAKLAAALADAQAQQIQDAIHYEGAEIMANDYGDAELWVYFTFTNLTNETISPLYNMDVTAFQNGRELSDHWDDSGWGDNIQPGYSMMGHKEFELTDWVSPIELVVYDSIWEWEDGNSYTLTIDPSTLPVTDMYY